MEIVIDFTGIVESEYVNVKLPLKRMLLNPTFRCIAFSSVSLDCVLIVRKSFESYQMRGHPVSLRMVQPQGENCDCNVVTLILPPPCPLRCPPPSPTRPVGYCERWSTPLSIDTKILSIVTKILIGLKVELSASCHVLSVA